MRTLTKGQGQMFFQYISELPFQKRRGEMDLFWVIAGTDSFFEAACEAPKCSQAFTDWDYSINHKR